MSDKDLSRRDIPENLVRRSAWPDSVSRAYGGQKFRFGREYLIPKPFDHRVLYYVAPAVAEAAMKTGS